MTKTINESSLSFKHGNNVVPVSFPNSGNAQHHITNILSGQDYPVLHCHFQPDCIIDIGANIGATALFFTDVYPNADCYCYEPCPSTFTYLQKNTSFLDRIKIFNCGLSNESRELKLYIGNAQCLQNSLYSSVEVTENFEIATIKPASTELKEIMSGKRCVLKIDTEGCEVPILEEIKDYLDNVDIFYLEYHSEEDRRAIDNLVAPQFSLCWSKASMVHRGNLMYLSQRLLSELPQLDAMAIRR
ncbi:FkbM family methyltransferase [Cyanothece sp. BG0011]|uniref:FkbM family methyltransferase n=1 Tax=Cyanothece sp. BG0011 TaxID=2082950 RepID=UPI00130037E6|nr:FkbM family methyltransferase [Cyanothece sp. BG0011]